MARPDAPYRRLAAAIILQALSDARDPAFRAECRRFFRGKWYATLAGYLGLPPVDPMRLDASLVGRSRLRKRRPSD